MPSHGVDDQDRSLLERGSELLGVDLDDRAIEKLLAYAGLLRRWNDHVNLISRRDMGRVIERHIVDGLAPLQRLGEGAVADLGSGGGIPGLVIAIARPAQIVTLIDRSSKKTRFLQQVRAELGLANVEVINAELESLALPNAFDHVTLRAVAEGKALSRLLRTVLGPTGIAYWQRGPTAAQSNDIPAEFEIADEITYELPDSDARWRLTSLRWRRPL